MAKCDTITIEEAAEPNLVVIDFDCPDTADVDETVTLSATVQNQGDAPGSGTVQFTVEGGNLAEKEVSLNPEYSTTVSTSPYFQETGDYTLCAEIGDSQECSTITIEKGGWF